MPSKIPQSDDKQIILYYKSPKASTLIRENKIPRISPKKDQLKDFQNLYKFVDKRNTSIFNQEI